MSEILDKLFEPFPNSPTEVLYLFLLYSLGTIILLEPDSFLLIGGINMNPVLDQPGWVGLLMIIGGTNVVLITKFTYWVKAKTP